MVNRCANLGWGTFSIQQVLSDLTGLPVKAGNDANVAALGECWKGGGRSYHSMILVTLGTGIGGGIVVDGRILYGAHGARWGDQPYAHAEGRNRHVQLRQAGLRRSSTARPTA